MSTENRSRIRAKSADFLEQMVKKVAEKEEPASPQVLEKNMQKIEQITNDLKAKHADKPKSKNYWEKKQKTK